MPRLWRNVLIVTALGVGVFAAISIYADLDKLGNRLAQFSMVSIVLALVLALGNYLIRWARWEGYLRRTGHKVPRTTSLLVFISGFAMSVTPGKVGELFKAALLRETAQSTMARTVPIVVAERVTDLISVVILGLVGVALYGVAVAMVVAGTVAMALGMLVIAYRPLAYGSIRFLEWMKISRKLTSKLRELYDNLAHLVKPAPLTWATAMGMAAWLCECLGFALIVRSFPGAQVPMGLAMLIYAATTVAGALSFLPGGLVVTEASMVLLLVRAAGGLDEPAAVAATILIRLCTLWFAVLLGLIALTLVKRAFPDAVRAVGE
jgi:glycosyltransferase 2 family protein